MLSPLTTFANLLVTGMGLLPFGDFAEPTVNIRSAVVFDGVLICLGWDGSAAVWNLTSGKYATDSAAKFTRKGLTGLAEDGDKLWAADEKTLYLWSAKEQAWKKHAAFVEDESLVAITPAGGVPFLVFPSKVIDPTREKGGTFTFPKDIDTFRKPPLRILATHGTDTMVWVGTGNGEWGGALIGLDPKTGKWVNSRGLAGYVTGITHAAKGEVVVSWSMSHFRADTQLKVHNLDATEKAAHPRLENKYYQCLAHNAHDETLYGIERSNVVSIEDGKPTRIAGLLGRLYEREPNAIGVAPGVLALIPVGPKTLAIVPKRGTPWLLQNGRLLRLRTP